MVKITNAVLATKIDNLSSEINGLKNDVKKNSEFRLQAKGMMTAFSAIGATIGAGIVWVLSHLFGGK